MTWFRIWVAFAAVTIVVYMSFPDGGFGSITYLSVDIGASIAAWIGVFVAPRNARRIAAALATGITLTTLGDAIWELYATFGGTEPDVSVADIGWVGCYVAIAVALGLLLRGDRRRLELDGVIDVAVVTIVVLLLAWEPAIAPLLNDTSVPVLARLVWAVYPVLDAVIVALVIRVAVSRRVRGELSLYVGVGAVCWLVADYAFLLTPTLASDAVLNGLWLVGAVCFAAGAWAVRGRHAPQEPVAERIGLWRIGIALVPLALPGALEVVTHFRGGDDINPVPGIVASVVLIALAFARTARISALERDARTELRSRERYFSALATNSSDAVIVVDGDGVVVDDFPRLAALVGHAGTSTAGYDAKLLVSDMDVDAMRTMLARAVIEPGEVFEAEFRARHGGGHEIWLAARMVSRLDDPDVHGVVINLHEITDRKYAEEELAHQAFHDSLTGLANRRLFANRVEHALHRSARTGLDPAVIYLDLDGFKTVNDSLGHEAGDDLLRQVARRLLIALRAGDTAARLGGDEFAVLIEQSNHPADEAIAVAERVLQALTAPMVVSGRSITVSASVGIAVSDGDSSASSLLRDADVAMYQAKSTGKSKWVVYDGGMRAAAVERLELENDLIGALELGQFELVYQPVVELESERIVGFEALLRWHHPIRGTVMPDVFIPIAEETGLIVAIGRWVLATACRTAADWQRRFPRPVPLSMAVNLSARQLGDPHLVDDVDAVLRDSQLTPSSLVLEMTETVLVDDAPLAATRLSELRSLGVRLAIDDFGTGYSSLSYLRQFPVDILKIDRSFISTITDREQLPAIVRGLLDLGRTLQMETVAEGIEIDLQYLSLRDQQCGLGQGYLFARPMSADEAELLLMQLGEGPIGHADRAAPIT